MKRQTKPLSIRIPLELKEELQKIADKEYRPLATQIVKILSDYVKNKIKLIRVITFLP
ncbi:TPA: hypothetical protein ROE33_000414 [Campylobacter jejuni]|nr:hypothetical protein [Campylobacter jejuni]HEA7277719.1 hypothetical protein [Campylobacter jejuni]HEA7789883.1 hypothetical protein [Campylobacter jejuni]HEA7905797.1 hypothetical protein [Campylobacter jejuni]HEA8255856.1 hypothetical protein [Campylobacter jejuni]